MRDRDDMWAHRGGSGEGDEREMICMPSTLLVATVVYSQTILINLDIVMS